MTDRHKVYTKVVKTLKQMMEMDHQGHLVSLAMMITGIVIGRNAHLSAMSTEVPVNAKEKSIEMRLRRWVKHSKIEVEAIYMPFAQQMLQALASNSLVLVMDGNQIGRGCKALMVGVLYKKRALPIAWIVYRGKKGHATAQRHIQALEKVRSLLPAESEVVLLGDAEYDTTERCRFGCKITQPGTTCYALLRRFTCWMLRKVSILANIHWLKDKFFIFTTLVLCKQPSLP